MYFSCFMLTTIILRKREREIAGCFMFNFVYAIIRLFGFRFSCWCCPGFVCDYYCDQTHLYFSSKSLYAVFCPVDVPKLKSLPSQTWTLYFNLNKEVSINSRTSQRVSGSKTFNLMPSLVPTHVHDLLYTGIIHAVMVLCIGQHNDVRQ